MSVTITPDMEPLRFANRVRDLVTDPRQAADALARDPPADRCFLVFFTPRSGSTWLTRIVRATDCLGYLEEYLNPAFVRDVAMQMHAIDPATLLAMLLRQARTDNGVFSMELRAVDVALFGEEAFFTVFGPGTVVFFLWRDNVVAQGISLARAVATNRYHSTDAATPPPAYDAAQIAEWTRHVVEVENANLALLRARGLRARFLCYEQVVRDRAATLARIADAMGIALTPEQMTGDASQDLRKIADDWNHEAERQFRAEHGDFIRDLAAQRLIRQRAG